MQSALDRTLTKVCDTEKKVLVNLVSLRWIRRERMLSNTVTRIGSFFMYALSCANIWPMMTCVLCDAIRPCEVKHVLSGQGGTITVVLVLENDKLVWN
jgi:hypothetical protein